MSALDDASKCLVTNVIACRFFLPGKKRTNSFTILHCLQKCIQVKKIKTGKLQGIYTVALIKCTLFKQNITEENIFK